MKAAALCGTALCLAASAFPARADVFEIAANGAVTVRAHGASGVIEIGASVANDAEPMPDIPTAALTTIDQPAVPAAYQASLAQAAATAKVSPTLLAALVWQESRWHPTAISPKGARGLTQLMPATARALSVDASDAASNLAGGARYLRRMLDMFDGNVELALAAYNAGPGRVMKTGTGIPAISETRAYVSSIIDRLGVSGSSRLAGVTP